MPPKEIRKLDRKLLAARDAARELLEIAMDLGLKDVEEAAETAHDALSDCLMRRSSAAE